MSAVPVHEIHERHEDSDVDKRVPCRRRKADGAGERGLQLFRHGAVFHPLGRILLQIQKDQEGQGKEHSEFPGPRAQGRVVCRLWGTFDQKADGNGDGDTVDEAVTLFEETMPVGALPVLPGGYGFRVGHDSGIPRRDHHQLEPSRAREAQSADEAAHE